MENTLNVSKKIEAKSRQKRVKDTHLHPYTVGEEIFNWVSHAVGAVFGMAVLISCMVVSAIRGNGLSMTGSIVYGISMIMLYTMSTLYHALRAGKAKKVLRVIDHCTIYLLIAGTYSAILLTSIINVNIIAALIVLAVEWLTAALAITLTAIDMKKYAIFSMICYIVLGWAVVAILPIAWTALTPAGFVFLLCGGLAYTIGAVLYGFGKNHKYMHSIFHLFCIIGSVLQFVCIIGFSI